TANNTYTGGTFVEGGVLQLGDGGTAGGITGDIHLQSGNLIVDRGNLMILDGKVTGGGGLIQNGTGRTVLTGNNTYSGDTVVNTGTLYVDGNQENSASVFTVKGGATLGGTGTIGTGTVSVESGGILNPGGVAVVPGTLTMNGNLNLENDAVLDYNFGQANVVGGPFNDLTVVKGDLTLGGEINVALSPDGKFDPGVYRVITYDGVLTDKVLTIGTLPEGQNPVHWSAQTNIANEVNLITSQGLSLNFWDGGGTPDNNKVEGGTQVWNADPADRRWTDDAGKFNGEWSQAGFGIFMATPGTVTVSNGYGNVETSGMQFAVGGYEITGDDLTLVNGVSSGTAIVRVGDGSSLGSHYTTQISANLIGDAVLEKTDLGTLILSGTNTYTGGTKINNGTLVGNIPVHSNLTVEKGAVYDGNKNARSIAGLNGGGTVKNTAGLTIDNGNFGGNIDDTNTGTVTKTTGGTLELTGANTFNNEFEIAQGTLKLSGEGAIANADVVMKNGTNFDIAGVGSSPSTVSSLSVTENTTIGLGSNQLNLDGKDISFNIDDTIHSNDVISTTTGTGSVSIENSIVHLNVVPDTWAIGDTIILMQNNVLTPQILNVDAPSSFTATAELSFWVGVREDDLIATWKAVRLDPRTPLLLEPNLASLAMVNQGQDWMHNVGFTLLDTSQDKVRCAVPCGRTLSLKNGWLTLGGFEGGSSHYQTGGTFDLDSYHIHAGLGKKTRNTLGKLSFGGIFQAGFGNYAAVDTFAGVNSVRGSGDSDYYGGLFFAKQFFENNNYASLLVNFGNIDTEYETYGLNQFVSFNKNTPYVGTSVAAGRLWKLRKHITADTFVRYFYNELHSDSIVLQSGDPLRFSTAQSNRLQVGTRLSWDSAKGGGVKPLQFYAGGIYEYEFSGKVAGTSFGLPIASRELRGGTGIGELGLNYVRGAWTTDFSIRGYAGTREGISGYAGFGYKF
ncbi:MAG: autotransporter-associated beta strand repeat-containing protein, partial [Planctomycetaceae bacterium]|nr:autotransporter-associated beta strand repeat-containing protein [Planctomycetaceae bacterium]